MISSIKITSLSNIGANLSANSVFPVVDMSNNPVTCKTDLQAMGNVILAGAGGQQFAPAGQAILAQSVTNAAQPNITSVGTLSTLAVTGNANVGGNLVLANSTNIVSTPGSNGNITLDPDGTGVVNVLGNVVANNFSGNISITGNVQGTSPNVQLVAGSYTWTFDNTGLLTIPAAGGNEGGEIDFAQAPNSTLSGNTVVVDQYVDRLRIFENGGNIRGVYVDLTQAAAGVGTLLNNRVSGIVNAGTYVTMDNLKATVSTVISSRSLQIATVSGSFAAYISATYTLFGGGVAGTGASITVTTTPALALAWNFTAQGDMATYIINDTTNSRTYRITMMIGGNYNNNMISIERLI